jgi:MFS family permease
MTVPESTDAAVTDVDRLIARIERVPVSRFHLRVAGTLGAGTFFDAFDIVAIGVVLTAISGTFHLTAAAAGWLISAGFLGQGIGAIGFGFFSERLGRRHIFLAALLVIGAFAALSVGAWNGFSLGAMRFLQGLGLGAEVPVASALLSELVAGPRRGRISVLYKLASPLGNLLTSLVAAALLAAATPETAWRLLFAIGAAPLIVAAVALFALGWISVMVVAGCQAALQLAAPDGLRGRIMSLHTLIYGGVFPFGAFTVGSISERWGVSWAYRVTGVFGLLALGVVLALWQLRARATSAVAGGRLA